MNAQVLPSRCGIVEIYGPESSGKTTLTLQVIAAAQREGKTCAFILLAGIRLRTQQVVDIHAQLARIDRIQRVFRIDERTGSGAVDVIVVDSVAALTPKAEIEGEIGDSHMGLAARWWFPGYRTSRRFSYGSG
jgi:recombination protein RecA